VRGVGVVAVPAATSMSCTGAGPSAGGGSSPGARSTTAVSPQAAGSTIDSRVPVELGRPIDVASLMGRIVLSTEDDIYIANADGTGLVRVTRRPGPEFDPAWSPDGRRIVYRDSRRGINQNDEIYVMNADGTSPRNLTKDRPDHGTTPRRAASSSRPRRRGSVPAPARRRARRHAGSDRGSRVPRPSGRRWTLPRPSTARGSPERAGARC
jgi:dipeptidyl aminopeptidase/acylaminoacyl peptidase